jgi:hypothetical protein
MRSWAATACCLSILSLALRSSALEPHSIGPEIEVTTGSLSVNQEQETKSAAFDRGYLYATWWACTDATNCAVGMTGDIGVYARRYDAATWTPSSDVTAFSNAGNNGAIIHSPSYHNQPSLGVSGNDLLLFDNNAATYTCSSSAGQAPPYWRRAPLSAFLSPAAWINQDTNCLPAAKSAGASLDLSGVGSVKCLDMGTVALPNGSFILSCKSPGWTGMAGIGQTISRRTASGAWRGPFWFTKSASGLTPPDNSCDVAGARNSFTTGGIRQRDGVLYIVWDIKNEFDSDTPPLSTQYHVYNLYAAKSVDGGITWTDLDGGHSFVAAEEGVGTAPTYDTGNMADPFPNYRIWSGDLNLGTETQFDIDTAGYPVIALQPYLSGGTALCGRPNGADVTSVYGLSLLRHSGGSWVASTIDAGGGTAGKNWRSVVAVPFVDSENRIWLFRSGMSGASPATTAYTVTTDSGSSWKAWTGLMQDVLGSSSAPQRLSPTLDPNRRWIAMSYSIPSSFRLFSRFIQVVEEPTVCCK